MGIGCQEKLYKPHHCKHPRSGWMLFWATWPSERCQCPWQSTVLDHLERSLPTLTTWQFYDPEHYFSLSGIKRNTSATSGVVPNDQKYSTFLCIFSYTVSHKDVYVSSNEFRAWNKSHYLTASLPGQIILVLSTGRFSLLAAKAGAEKEPVWEWIPRLVRLSGDLGAVLPVQKKQK